MSKSHICISLDVGLMEECKRMGIIVSSACNEYLTNLTAIKKNNPNLATIQELKSSIHVLQLDFTKVSSELKAKEVMLQEIERKEAEAKEKIAKKESEQIQAQKSCLQCGRPINEVETKYPFKNGAVCYNCMWATHLKDRKNWDGVV
jgi:hypothetical protein